MKIRKYPSQQPPAVSLANKLAAYSRQAKHYHSCPAPGADLPDWKQGSLLAMMPLASSGLAEAQYNVWPGCAFDAGSDWLAFKVRDGDFIAAGTYADAALLAAPASEPSLNTLKFVAMKNTHDKDGWKKLETNMEALENGSLLTANGGNAADHYNPETGMSFVLNCFDIEAAQGGVRLVWTTCAEQNNSGFEVQRSANTGQFYKIGWVESKGTNNENCDYAFFDANIEPNASYYYRLRQLDRYGAAALSPVLDAMVRDENELRVELMPPDPASPDQDLVRFRVNVPEKSELALGLFNEEGGLIKSLVKPLEAGASIFSLPVGDVEKGTFFLKMQTGKRASYQKLTLTNAWRCCLPTDSTLPDITTLRGSEMSQLLPDLARRFAFVRGELSSSKKILLPSQIACLFDELYFHARAAFNQAFSRSANAFVQLNPVFEQGGNFQEDIISDNDDFYRIDRYDAADAAVYVREVLRTLSEQVAVLANSQVSRHEMLALTTGMAAVLEDLVSRTAATPISQYPNIPIIESPVPASCPRQAAFHRWRVAHWSFAIMVQFSADALQRAHAAFAAQDWEGAESYLRRACLFFRASTAVMWTSSDFNSAIYLNWVRPMISARLPNGPSGNLLRDFEHWRAVKNDFLKEVRAVWETVPPAFQKAVSDFRYWYILDSEAHTLIIAEILGKLPSLSQAEAEKAYHLKSDGAVEGFRRMTEQRKAEFSFIFQK